MKTRQFEVFLSHHSGPGGAAARVMSHIMMKLFKGSVFYDVDWKDYHGVIFDAIKLSNNMILMYSTESLCRSWVIGACVAAYQKNLPMQTVVLDSDCPSNRQYSADIDCSKADHHVPKAETNAESTAADDISINFEPDSSALRAHGVCKNDVAPALVKLISHKPVHFNLKDEEGLKLMVNSTFADMPSTNLGQLEYVVREFFVDKKHFSDEWLKKGSTMLVSSDHDDMEATSVARLLHCLLTANISALKTALAPVSNGQLVVDMGARLAQLAIHLDYDLAPEEYKKMVSTDSIAVVIVLVTGHTMKSVPQLARLGLAYKYKKEIQPVPIIMGKTFEFPNESTYAKLEAGKTLSLGSNPSESLAEFAGELVTLTDVRQAVSHTLSFFVTFIDLKGAGLGEIQTGLVTVMQRSAMVLAGVGTGA